MKLTKRTNTAELEELLKDALERIQLQDKQLEAAQQTIQQLQSEKQQLLSALQDMKDKLVNVMNSDLKLKQLLIEKKQFEEQKLKEKEERQRSEQLLKEREKDAEEREKQAEKMMISAEAMKTEAAEGRRKLDKEKEAFWEKERQLREEIDAAAAKKAESMIAEKMAALEAERQRAKKETKLAKDYAKSQMEIEILEYRWMHWLPLIVGVLMFVQSAAGREDLYSFFFSIWGFFWGQAVWIWDCAWSFGDWVTSFFGDSRLVLTLATGLVLIPLAFLWLGFWGGLFYCLARLLVPVLDWKTGFTAVIIFMILAIPADLIKENAEDINLIWTGFCLWLTATVVQKWRSIRQNLKSAGDEV